MHSKAHFYSDVMVLTFWKYLETRAGFRKDKESFLEQLPSRKKGCKKQYTDTVWLKFFVCELHSLFYLENWNFLTALLIGNLYVPEVYGLILEGGESCRTHCGLWCHFLQGILQLNKIIFNQDSSGGRYIWDSGCIFHGRVQYQNVLNKANLIVTFAIFANLCSQSFNSRNMSKRFCTWLTQSPKPFEWIPVHIKRRVLERYFQFTRSLSFLFSSKISNMHKIYFWNQKPFPSCQNQIKTVPETERHFGLRSRMHLTVCPLQTSRNTGTGYRSCHSWKMKLSETSCSPIVSVSLGN